MKKYTLDNLDFLDEVIDLLLVEDYYPEQDEVDLFELERFHDLNIQLNLKEIRDDRD